MPQFENPTVLVTRPKEASDRFIHALKRQASRFQVLVQPAFELIATDKTIPEFDAAVFTSRAGVEFAPKGAGRVAYCVGDATAEAARDKGYVANSARGSASDLSDMILNLRPRDRLLHIRGETSVGDVSTTLNNGGVPCAEHVAYRKSIIAPDPIILKQLEQNDNVILPLFSAETVSILMQWPVDFQKCHGVTISAQVARQAVDLRLATIVTSEKPDLGEMVAQTARLIA